jgi:C4-dicarboxylate-specific signal transduction histidine kinase
MTFGLDEKTLSQLFPFSFLTDRDGVILDAGPSLRRRCPRVRPGTRFLEVFSLLVPSVEEAHSGRPEALSRELVVLEDSGSAGFRLRGQVVPLSGTGQAFLFSLNPGVMDLDEMKTFGIEFDDFPPGDSLFDFVLLTQSQKAAQARLESALARMDLESRVSQILYQITRKTSGIQELEETCEIALSGVCDGLSWERGKAHCKGSTEAEEDSLVRRTFQEQKVIWNPAFAGDPGEASVAVPVTVEGETVAVLEFFAGPWMQTFDSLTRLFESLSILMGGVVERQRCQAREKEQWASLVTASRLASLGEIAAGVAHEINNPLATISIVGQTLEREAETGCIQPAALRKQIQRINVCVRRIIGIVTGLSDLSRNSIEDPLEPCSLSRILEETLDLCYARFFHYGVELRLPSIDPGVEVRGRASQVLQVLLNLLNNAFDAVQDLEEKWVEVSLRKQEAQIEISVTDSGRGIPREVASNLMKPFFTTKVAGKGTGLGLSICTRIVEEHGGRLWLDEQCANTRFVLELPR